VLDEANISAPLASFLSRAVELNVLLAVFNMLPIPPLDGGNVLSGLLPLRFASLFNQIRPYGFILLYALILTNGFYYLVFRPALVLRSLLP
jgi:Zn-dependent protease